MPKDKVHQPHDKLVKTTLTIPEVAQDFINHHLPMLKKRYQLSELTYEEGTFIDSEFAKTEADLLFKTRFGQHPGYLYILLEHQNDPIKLMPFRLLKYMVRIIEKYLNKTGKKTLPLVMPLVFYTGRRRWHYSTDIIDLFEAPRELVEQVWLQPFKLIEAAQVDLESSKTHPFSAILSWVMAHIREPNFIEKFEQEALSYLPIHHDLFFNRLFLYIINESDTTFHKFEKLLSKHIDTEVGEKMSSLAEQLIQKGEKKGKLEGKLEGEKKGKINIAQNLLKEGTDPKFVAKVTGLSVKQVNGLLKK